MSVIGNEERIAELTGAFRAALLGELKKVWTAMPAIVQQASDGHTAQVQVSINGHQITVDGQIQHTPISLHLDAPVHYPGGGNHTFTHPVQPGDEGAVVYTSRAQDVWHQNGGTNNDPIDDRMFALSDGRWIPGGRSDPRKLSPAASQTSSQQRSDDGNHVVDVNQSNGVTHASTKKVLSTVGQSASTLHVPGRIIKNAAQVLINTVGAQGIAPPGITIANGKLVATKPLSVGALGGGGGSIGSILSGVLTGGAGSVLSDPTAAVNSSLSSAITSAASAVSGVSGASGLVAALTGSGGLQSVLATFGGYTSNLSGASLPSTGNFGLADVLGHVQNVTAYFGASPPPSVAPATVTAPIQSSPTLTGMTSTVVSIAAQVVAGTLTPSAATTQVNGMASTLNNLVSASQTAISTLQNAIPALNSVMGAVSAATSSDPAEAAVSGMLAGANFHTLVTAAQAILSAPAQTFPDPASSQQGATGGV